jgi:hypothetical protein
LQIARCNGREAEKFEAQKYNCWSIAYIVRKFQDDFLLLRGPFRNLYW